MDATTKSSRVIRFSVFEVDLGSGELFKQGRKVRLQGLPFEILVTLLQRPGDVVSREDLRQKCWPADLLIDFDQGLNRAINKLRDALNDSVETPRFVETVPRRGYRFIAPLQQESAAAPPTAVERPPAPKSGRTIWSAAVAAAIIVAFGVLALWRANHQDAQKAALRLRQLTTNSAENPIDHAILSADGKYLAWSDRAGIQIRLIGSGESHVLPKPEAVSAGDVWAPVAWFPDQTHILAYSVQLTSDGLHINAWSVAVIGGGAVLIREHALAQSMSPDGSQVAFTMSRAPNWETLISTPWLPRAEIWLMGPRGENARRIVRGDDQTSFGVVRWSPDGRRLAYATSHPAGGIAVQYAIVLRDLDRGADAVVFRKTQEARFTPGVALDLRFPDFAWLPDNRIVFPLPEPPPNNRDTNLWAFEVDPETEKARSEPVRISSLTNFHMQAVNASHDGKRLLVESTTDESHVYVARIASDGTLAAGRRLTLDQRYNTPYAWTPDSRFVIFSSDRTGSFALYKQALDAQAPELIPGGPESSPQARVSPDGGSLVYAALSNAKDPAASESVRMMAVPLAGGPARLLFEVRSPDLDFDCPHRGSQCIAADWDVALGTQIFFSFDPLSGVRHELFRTGRIPNWTVAPDGSRIAESLDDSIGLLSLSGQLEKKFQMHGWPHPLSMSVDWAADSRALFVSHQGLIASPGGPVGATLLRLDLQGRVKPIWETRGARFTWGIASPDGKYLAIREPAVDRNAWTVENF